MIVDEQGADADAHSKGDERRRARADIYDCRVVDGNINNLGIHGLNYIKGLAPILLQLNLLLLGGAQRTGAVGLIAQALDGSGDGSLIGLKCLADGGVVVDILRHHLEHFGEIHQRNKRWIEPLLLRGIGQGYAGESGILRQPIVDIQNFLRVGGGGGDLRKQRVGIESDGSQQLIELGGRRNCRLREKRGPKLR